MAVDIVDIVDVMAVDIVDVMAVDIGMLWLWIL